jgi:hypothetical protein
MTRALLLLGVLAVLAACVPQPAVPERPAEVPQVLPAAVVPAEQALPEEVLVEEEAAAEQLPAPAEPAVQGVTSVAVPVGSGKVQGCPEGYSFAGGYCVEDACQNKQVKCMVSGNLVKRPDCECWMYLGEPICSIKAAEETRIKSPRCARKGQVGGVCGAYDSNRHHCVAD